MRILITGSRGWTDRTTIGRIIMNQINMYCPMLMDANGNPDRRDVSQVTIVHGAARGADQLAGVWAAGCEPPLTTEPHPVTNADWSRNPRVAGYMRNEHMVGLGADVCIAFILPCMSETCRRIESHGSHGASHCADLAELSGIETLRITR